MKLWILASLPVVIIIFLYTNTGILFENQYDDSYITYRYAANFARGHGLVFNEGEKTNAASSFLYTILLSIFYKLGLTDLEVVAVVINLFSTAGISVLTYKIVYYLSRSSKLGLFSSFIISFHGFISGWSISGMETVFFTFLVTFFVFLNYFTGKVNNFIVMVTVVLLCLTRLEGLLIYFIWVISQFDLRKFYNRFMTFQIRGIFSYYKKSYLYFICGFLLIGLFYFFLYDYYGSFLPNSFIFKKNVAYYQPRIMTIFLIWISCAGMLLLLSLIESIRNFAWKYFSIYLYIIVSILSFIIGPYSDGARYTVHILPIIVIFGSLVLVRINKSKNKYSRFILGFCILLIFIQTILSAFIIRHYLIRDKTHQICRNQMSQFINKRYLGQYVLSGDLGLIAYNSLNIKFIDLGGLTSKDVLMKYLEKGLIDEIIDNKRPVALADSFNIDENSLVHPLLMNKVEYIIGKSHYSNLFNHEIFKSVLFRCNSGNRVFAIVDLRELYK